MISNFNIAISKSERRAFLKGDSAKMMGLRADLDHPSRSKNRSRGEIVENAEDHSNLKLDKTLHHMLLSTLLPAAAADAALRPVDKRNALSGRLLELASYSLPGEGSKSIKTSQLSKHPASVRTGLIHAKSKREEKSHAEAYAASGAVRGYDGKKMASDKGKKLRAEMGQELGRKKGMGKRQEMRGRGLRMGVGKFEGGTLKLSERDIRKSSGARETGFRGIRGKRRE
ncbi:MAG: hypothetical protein TREMPRED_005876 [Tremellales sp. Tagirdzhanova-0007]|nr:MAG: hypothetical protein TREMPRED_005876 [Tremellales sp. Tagirdzhanova-0007]